MTQMPRARAAPHRAAPQRAPRVLPASASATARRGRCFPQTARIQTHMRATRRLLFSAAIDALALTTSRCVVVSPGAHSAIAPPAAAAALAVGGPPRASTHPAKMFSRHPLPPLPPLKHCVSTACKCGAGKKSCGAVFFAIAARDTTKDGPPTTRTGYGLLHRGWTSLQQEVTQGCMGPLTRRSTRVIAPGNQALAERWAHPRAAAPCHAAKRTDPTSRRHRHTPFFYAAAVAICGRGYCTYSADFCARWAQGHLTVAQGVGAKGAAKQRARRLADSACLIESWTYSQSATGGEGMCVGAAA